MLNQRLKCFKKVRSFLRMAMLWMFFFTCLNLISCGKDNEDSQENENLSSTATLLSLTEVDGLIADTLRQNDLNWSTTLKSTSDYLGLLVDGSYTTNDLLLEYSLITDFLDQGKPVIFLDLDSSHSHGISVKTGFAPKHDSLGRIYQKEKLSDSEEATSRLVVYEFNESRVGQFGQAEHLESFTQEIQRRLQPSHSVKPSHFVDDLHLVEKTFSDISPDSPPLDLPHLIVNYIFQKTISSDFVTQFPDIAQLVPSPAGSTVGLFPNTQPGSWRNAFGGNIEQEKSLINFQYSENLYLFHDDSSVDNGGGWYYVIGSPLITSTPINFTTTSLSRDDASCGTFATGSLDSYWYGPSQSKWDINWTLQKNGQNSIFPEPVVMLETQPQNQNSGESVSNSSSFSIGFSGKTPEASYTWGRSETTTITDWGVINKSGGYSDDLNKLGWIWLSQNQPPALLTSQSQSESSSSTLSSDPDSWLNSSSYLDIGGDDITLNQLNTHLLEMKPVYGWKFGDKERSNQDTTTLLLQFQGTVQADAWQYVDDGYCIGSWNIGAGVSSTISHDYVLFFDKIQPQNSSI